MKNKIKNLFISLQEQLSTNLRANRTISNHPQAKGDATEINWVRMLEEHLPQRYQISKAFVIDSNGNTSDQIDIVIYDRQYTPLLYNRDGQRFIPAESVYAILEVKQVLDKNNIIYAGEKAESVRKLDRTRTSITHAGGEFHPKPPFQILAGILCYQSDWNPPFGESFISTIQGLAPAERLDIGCSLINGSFEVVYNLEQEANIKINDGETTLISFFFNFLQRLQSVGTVPAIDYQIYRSKIMGD